MSEPTGGAAASSPDAIVLAELVTALLVTDEAAARRRRLQTALASLGADSLLPALQDEVRRRLRADAHAALRLAEAAVVGALQAERRDHYALGLLIKGDALNHLGRYREAVRAYETARRSFRAQGDEIGWARTHIGWVVACHHLGRGAAALRALARPRDILASAGQLIRAADLNNNAGYVCWRLGRYDEALRRYDDALAMCRALGNTAERRIAWFKGNKALICTLLGDFDAALSLFSEVRVVSVNHGDTANVLRVDQYTADVYAGRGDYTQALRLFGDTLAALEQAGLEVDAGWTALSMVECYLRLNRDEEAFALAQEALSLFQRYGTPTEAARAYLACALALGRLGDAAQAVAFLEEAERIFARTRQVGQLGQVALHHAEVSLAEGNSVDARRAAMRAEALAAEHGLTVRQAQAMVLRSRAALALGRLKETTRLARAALAIAEQRGLPWLAYECHHLLAGAARVRGADTLALAEYQAAIDGIDDLQRRLVPQLRTSFLADKLQVYHDAIDCCLANDRPAQAFAFLERAKSRALVDYLTAHPAVRVQTGAAAEPALVEELARLRGEHAWFYNRLHGYGLGRPGETGETTTDQEVEMATLQAAIAERERRIGRLLERLTLRQSGGQAETPAALIGASDELPPLDNGTVLLEYYLHADTALAFVVASGQLTVVPLPTPPAYIERHLRLWQLNLEATAQALSADTSLDLLARNAQKVLGALYEALLRPVEEHLQGRRRVVVVPFGALHSLPFHALHDGERYLIERMEVVVSPSSSLLRLCTARPPRPAMSLLVLAHSDEGRLPCVLSEAATISDQLPGRRYCEEQATRAALVAAAADHSIIHLAAHGEARADNPIFAHLKLADGQLTMTDVFNLPLAGALVVLSACESGRGVVTGGDEVVGLSRGFLYAGATTVVQSLWRVEDGSTARLMGCFYQALSAGETKAAALRQAQLQLLRATAHPYLWAPFQLIGDGGAPISTANSAIAQRELGV